MIQHSHYIYVRIIYSINKILSRTLYIVIMCCYCCSIATNYQPTAVLPRGLQQSDYIHPLGHLVALALLRLTQVVCVQPLQGATIGLALPQQLCTHNLLLEWRLCCSIYRLGQLAAGAGAGDKRRV